jgi:hypothetical protein
MTVVQKGNIDRGNKEYSQKKPINTSHSTLKTASEHKVHVLRSFCAALWYPQWQDGRLEK